MSKLGWLELQESHDVRCQGISSVGVNNLCVAPSYGNWSVLVFWRSGVFRGTWDLDGEGCMDNGLGF